MFDQSEVILIGRVVSSTVTSPQTDRLKAESGQIRLQVLTELKGRLGSAFLRYPYRFDHHAFCPDIYGPPIPGKDYLVFLNRREGKLILRYVFQPSVLAGPLQPLERYR
jgi:hypothetical protein